MSLAYDKAKATSAREAAANASYVAVHAQAGRIEGSHAAHVAMGVPCSDCPKPKENVGNRFDTESTRSLVGVPRRHHAAYRAMPIRRDIPAIETRTVPVPRAGAVSQPRAQPPERHRPTAVAQRVPTGPEDPASADAANLRKGVSDIREAIIAVEKRLEPKRAALLEAREGTYAAGHTTIARWTRGEAPQAEISQLEAAIAHDEAVLAHLRGHR